MFEYTRGLHNQVAKIKVFEILSLWQSNYLSICLFIYLSLYLYLSIYITLSIYLEPAGKPVFLRDKIICLSQGFELYWTPPTLSSINGEFMGYVMTYRPTDSHDTTKLIVTDESLKIQVTILKILFRVANLLKLFQNYKSVNRYHEHLIL